MSGGAVPPGKDADTWKRLLCSRLLLCGCLVRVGRKLNKGDVEHKHINLYLEGLSL